MIDKLLQKLSDQEKDLPWFCKTFLGEDYDYKFFIRQLALYWEMTMGLEEAITGYLEE